MLQLYDPWDRTILAPHRNMLQLRYSYGMGLLLSPATTFGAPAASATAGHVGWREVARNRAILHTTVVIPGIRVLRS